MSLINYVAQSRFTYSKKLWKYLDWLVISGLNLHFKWHCWVDGAPFSVTHSYLSSQISVYNELSCFSDRAFCMIQCLCPPRAPCLRRTRDSRSPSPRHHRLLISSWETLTQGPFIPRVWRLQRDSQNALWIADFSRGVAEILLNCLESKSFLPWH